MLLKFAVFIFLFCATQPMSAKRAEPIAVVPVVHGNIRYVAPLDDCRRGYIEAWDIKSNKRLWSVTIFRTRINPKMETDVQCTFVRTMSHQDGALFITDELDRSYRLDLQTRKTAKVKNPRK